MEDLKDEQKHHEDEFHYNDDVNLRSILHNAIRMQALYSGRKIRIVETSTRTN